MRPGPNEVLSNFILAFYVILFLYKQTYYDIKTFSNEV